MQENKVDFADQSADIISSDSFKDASRLAQEYLQGQTGANIAKYRTWMILEDLKVVEKEILEDEECKR